MTDLIIVGVVMTQVVMLVGLILAWQFNFAVYSRTKPALANGFARNKIVFVLKIICVFNLFYAPTTLFAIYMLPHSANIFVLMVIIPLFIGLILTPEVVLSPHSKLAATKPLLSRTAKLHLKEHFQDFDIQTYKELLYLVELLPKYNVTKILLVSPMFYNAKGEQRSFDNLNKILLKRGHKLTHSPAKIMNTLIGKMSMHFSTDFRKMQKLQKINISKWHTLTITL